MAQPRVELLFWAGCPSYPEALAQLREAMAQAGLDPDGLTLREVLDEDDAQRERFVGSPTIRVDGRDVHDPGDVPPALACRVYRLPDGRFSPLPDAEDVRSALRAAAGCRS